MTIQATQNHPTPVFFFSHGSTMMLGEESEPGRFWEKVGQEAKRRGVKGLVIMGAHYEVVGDHFEISANAEMPAKQPVLGVAPHKYKNLPTPIDPKLAERVKDLLVLKGIKAKLNPNTELIHDIFLILRWMFGDEGPTIPHVQISTNAYYDPWKLIDIGAAVRPLRYENYLVIGTGGTVHNLYANKWSNIVIYRDNFAQQVPPDEFALDFRTVAEDMFTKHTGPQLRRAAMRLVKHPLYRSAHGTDDHYASALFCAGAAGSEEDKGPNCATAECWELVNMCNTQFQLGDWEAGQKTWL